MSIWRYPDLRYHPCSLYASDEFIWFRHWMSKMLDTDWLIRLAPSLSVDLQASGMLRPYVALHRRPTHVSFIQDPGHGSIGRQLLVKGAASRSGVP